MKKDKFLFLITFILVFLLHIIYAIWRLSKLSPQCIQIVNGGLLSLYVKRQDYFLSFSYALALAFTVYAFSKLLRNIKGSAACVAGGLTLTSLIYIGGCLLIGCCGSPLLAVYLGVFGAAFLGWAKPLVAIITTISVIFGYLWIKKKCKICGSTDERCTP